MAASRRALGGGDASPPGDAAVHRDLTLTTPETKGPDVKALQKALNTRGHELPFTDVNLDTDSEYGTHTGRAAHRVAFALGLSDDECQRIKGGMLCQLSQQLIRDPSGLSPEDRQRRRARKPILKRRYEAQQRRARRQAVKWARRQIGTTEHPKGSNWGHPVQDWITFTGYGGPVFWCGCFVAFAVVEKGGAQIRSPNPARPRHRHQRGRSRRQKRVRARREGGEREAWRHRDLRLPPHRPGRRSDEERDDPHDRRQHVSQQRLEQQRRGSRRAQAASEPGDLRWSPSVLSL